MCVLSHLVMYEFLRSHGLQLTRLLCLWDFPGKNTGVGCHFLLQGSFPDPGIKLMSPALVDVLFTTEPPITDNLAILAQILSLGKNKERKDSLLFV